MQRLYGAEEINITTIGTTENLSRDRIVSELLKSDSMDDNNYNTTKPPIVHMSSLQLRNGIHNGNINLPRCENRRLTLSKIDSRETNQTNNTSIYTATTTTGSFDSDGIHIQHQSSSDRDEEEDVEEVEEDAQEEEEEEEEDWDQELNLDELIRKKDNKSKRALPLPNMRRSFTAMLNGGGGGGKDTAGIGGLNNGNGGVNMPIGGNMNTNPDTNNPNNPINNNLPPSGEEKDSLLEYLENSLREKMLFTPESYEEFVSENTFDHLHTTTTATTSAYTLDELDEHDQHCMGMNNTHLKGIYSWVQGTSKALHYSIRKDNSNVEINGKTLMESEGNIFIQESYSFINELLSQCEQNSHSITSLYYLEGIMKYIRIQCHQKYYSRMQSDYLYTNITHSFHPISSLKPSTGSTSTSSSGGMGGMGGMGGGGGGNQRYTFRFG